MEPKQSEIDSGEICRRCYKYIMSPSRGHKRLCRLCRKHYRRMKSFDSDEAIAARAIWRRVAVREAEKICPGCKKKFNTSNREPTVDHIIPLSKGGLDKECNWQLLCRKCNVEKGDKVIFPPPGFKRGKQ